MGIESTKSNEILNETDKIVYDEHKYPGKDGFVTWVSEVKDSFKPGMTIDLSGKKIGAEGAKVLAMEWRDRLQPGMTIDLRGNYIGPEGSEYLGEPSSSRWRYGMDINLEGSDKLGYEGVDAIMNLVLKDGIRIFLDKNFISDKKKEEIAKWVEGYKNNGVNCDVQLYTSKVSVYDKILDEPKTLSHEQIQILKDVKSSGYDGDVILHL